MSENAKIQLSIKGQAPMLNIYADDHEDYLELLNGFLDEPQTDVVLAQTQVAVNVSAAFAAAYGLATAPTAVAAAPSAAAPTAAEKLAAPPVTDPWDDAVPAALQVAFKGIPRDCPHTGTSVDGEVMGPRMFREGRSKRGPWAGLFCPLPSSHKADQCKPEFGNLN